MSDFPTQHSEQYILNTVFDASTRSFKNTSTPVAASTLNDDRKVVTTAGTREQLASSTTCKSVSITAETDNTGVIVVGGSSVVAALATRRGTPLNPGDSVTVNIDNLSKVYLDTTVSGDGVTYTYVA